ncbi:MAG: DnaD domain protein [Oscillospiraceae bacterium]|nr:DnaD domain protein [Oscillospiraceae bacterium]
MDTQDKARTDARSDKQFSLPAPELITLSGQCVNLLIQLGDGDAALLYLYILQTRGMTQLEDAARALGRERDEIAATMAQLAKLGLVNFEDMLPEAPGYEATPRASVEDIRREMAHGTEFPELVLAIEGMLGKILGERDLQKLFCIYNDLKLPPEVILHLAANCVAEATMRGKPATVRQIEKEAFVWAREGVFTLEQAETHLRERDARLGAEGDICRVLNIRGRALSPTERKFIEAWITLGLGAEIIELAYDKTVTQTGKLTWKYMDTILNSWHGKGVTKPEDIAEKDAMPKNARSPQSAPPAAPDARELERMSRLLDSIKTN